MEEMKKALEEQELETVTGGIGSASGYNYVNMFFEGSSLILYSGYDVSNVHVYQDGSQIRYTYKMTPGQKETILYSENAPLLFKVTGRSSKTSETFEYSFDFSNK